MAEYGLEVTGISKTFGGNLVVNDVSFKLSSGEILGLVGPSGCGKTTSLRMIAGLETPNCGTIVIGGREVSGPGVHLPPEKRDIGMVFQSYALWPHMSVFDNIAVPLRLKKQKRAEIRQRVDELLEMVGLGGMGERYPWQLSGGQQQRVAVARSLAARPRLVLLDEPLSNLDARLRDQVRVELRELLKQLHITAVFVTHDQVEAMTLCDQIAVMRLGDVVQFGTPTEVYERPGHRFVAQFMGKANIIEATVRTAEGGDRWLLAAPGGIAITATCEDELEPGESVAVVARPEAFRTAPGAASSLIPATVLHSVYVGNVREWTVGIAGSEVRVALPVDVHLGEPGAQVDLYLPDSAVCIPGRQAHEARQPSSSATPAIDSS